jgi:hypothetical protein
MEAWRSHSSAQDRQAVRQASRSARIVAASPPVRRDRTLPVAAQMSAQSRCAGRAGLGAFEAGLDAGGELGFVDASEVLGVSVEHGLNVAHGSRLQSQLILDPNGAAELPSLFIISRLGKR